MEEEMSLLEYLTTLYQSKMPKEFEVDVSGGDGYRKLREEESEQLKESLNKFSEESTKISQQEIEFKKELVKWLVRMLKDALKGHLFRTYNTGSAYEKVQAGEAKDFDIMIFLNIRKWSWIVHDDPKKPGYCWLTRGAERKEDNPRSFTHLLDEDGRLSALKVRKLFTSKIDRFLRKNSPLEFEYAAPSDKATETQEGKEEPQKVKYKVDIKRKYQGPATTLTVECKGISPFTIDLVNSLHQQHIRSKGELCDYVAKPFNKQKIFSTEDQHLWRKSYSRQESKKLKDIDEGNKIHRKLLRIFKILRMNQPQLKLLKTYVLKNLLLYLSDDTQKDWSDDSIADRFVDMVIALRNCLANHRLPVYFNHEINLLKQSEYDSEKLDHVKGYLRRIANKGIQGYESLLAASKELQTLKRKLTAVDENSEENESATEKKTKSGDPAGTEEAQTSSADATPTAAATKPQKKSRKASMTKSKQPKSGGAQRDQNKRPKKKQQRFSQKNTKESDKVKENGKYIRKKPSSPRNAVASKPSKLNSTKPAANSSQHQRKESAVGRRNAAAASVGEPTSRTRRKAVTAGKAANATKGAPKVSATPSAAPSAKSLDDALCNMLLDDPWELQDDCLLDTDYSDAYDGADDYMDYIIDRDADEYEPYDY